MSLDYLLTDHKQANRRYTFSYRDTRDAYREFCLMPKTEFLANLPDAIHLAVFISYIKEIPTSVCLSDVGVVHESVHLLCDPGERERASSVRDARALFKRDLRLS